MAFVLLVFLVFAVKFTYQYVKTYSLRQIIKGESTRNFFNCLFLIKNDNKQFTTIALISYYWPKDYVSIFSIPSYIQFKNAQGVYQEIRHFKQKKLRQKVEDTLDMPVDFFISIKQTKAKKLVSKLGGVVIFNDQIKAFPQGRLYIDEANIKDYLNSISNEVVKIETGVSLAVNLLLSTFKNYVFFNDSKKLFSLLWHEIQTELPQNLAGVIVKKIAENYGTLYLDYGRMNTELINENGLSMHVPLQKGMFDAQKLKETMKQFNLLNKDLVRYPISLQVKNTTSVYRLAAKTTGVLRRKKCNVKEYLNSDIDLRQSLIIDRCGSVAKREYLKKITKVDDVYYLVDYRENFDFTLYLGEDYYGIPKLNQ